MRGAGFIKHSQVQMGLFVLVLTALSCGNSTKEVRSESISDSTTVVDTVKITTKEVAVGKYHPPIIDSGYFGPPLKIPLEASGTFAELRSNHFHSGLDLRTAGVEGQEVIAVAKGTVVRIKVSSFGFGKALYVQHPNGYTSVYAHLKKFNKEIQEYVEDQHYKRKSFEMDVYPPAGKLTVQKGETIALSGNTGGSGGPHLHFEIRDATSGHPINPIKAGIAMADKINPRLERVAIYNLDPNCLENTAQYPYVSFVPNSTEKTYHLKPGTYGLGAQWNDFFTDYRNYLGINQAWLLQGEKELFSFDLNSFAFAHTRYINSHIDYVTYKKHSRRYVYFFKLPGNQLPIYSGSGGAIKLAEGDTLQFKLIIEDMAGLQDVAAIKLIGKELNSATLSCKVDNAFSAGDLINYKSGGRVSAGNMVLQIPAQALYHNTRIRAMELGENLWQLEPQFLPIQKFSTLQLPLPKVTGVAKEKYVVMSKTPGGKWDSEGGSVSGNIITARIRNLGQYKVVADTVSPSIRRIRCNHNAFMFRIKDELSGIQSYQVTANGTWVLAEYDYKTGSLFGYFPNSVSSGTVDVKITVSDECGNENTLSIQVTKP